MMSFPEGWSQELWQECWNESALRWNITGVAWESLSPKSQFALAEAYQKWYSNTFHLPLEKTIDIPTLSLSKKMLHGLVLRLIPPGEFKMGSSEEEPGHNYTELQHPVAITHPYYFGTYLITQAQWLAIMGYNPSKFQNMGNDAPVEQITWLESQEFCQKLQNITVDSMIQIPTEAQWEYACRAGVTSRYFWADVPEAFTPYGWDKDNSGQNTHPVGQKLPNAWGLYDMAGLVWQWCRDVKAYYYLECLVEDPCNQDGYGRLIRGGSWRLPAKHFRAAIQIVREPDFKDGYLGLRIVWG